MCVCVCLCVFVCGCVLVCRCTCKVNQQYSVVDGCCIMCVRASQVLSRAINSPKLTLKRAKELYPMEVMPPQAYSLAVIVL